MPARRPGRVRTLPRCGQGADPAAQPGPRGIQTPLSGFCHGIRKLAPDREADPVRTIQELAVKDPDRSRWPSFRDKNVRPKDEDLWVQEARTQGGELWAKTLDDDGDRMEFRLSPLGENRLGRKGGRLALIFREGSVTCLEETRNKL